jgi:hypothetical protein
MCKYQCIEIGSFYLPYYLPVYFLNFVNWLNLLWTENGVNNSIILVFYNLLNCLRISAFAAVVFCKQNYLVQKFLSVFWFIAKIYCNSNIKSKNLKYFIFLIVLYECVIDALTVCPSNLGKFFIFTAFLLNDGIAKNKLVGIVIGLVQHFTKVIRNIFIFLVELKKTRAGCCRKHHHLIRVILQRIFIVKNWYSLWNLEDTIQRAYK